MRKRKAAGASVARLLHKEKPAGASVDFEGEGESSDDFVDEITASPLPFEYYHGEDLEDDPQLTLGNLKKFQANVREFTRFSVVSSGFEYFSLLYVPVNLKLIVNCYAANVQSLVFEVTEAEGDGCGSSKDLSARERECYHEKG